MLPMTSCGCSEFKIFTPHVLLHTFYTILNGILYTTKYKYLCHSDPIKRHVWIAKS